MLLRSYDIPSHDRGVYASGLYLLRDYAYVADEGSGLKIIGGIKYASGNSTLSFLHHSTLSFPSVHFPSFCLSSPQK